MRYKLEVPLSSRLFSSRAWMRRFRTFAERETGVGRSEASGKTNGSRISAAPRVDH